MLIWRHGGITSLSATGKTVCFGAFEFNRLTGEVRKHGLRIRLQGQPVEVLAILLERRGELVSREELQKSLWPAETFVDFEHSLNAAIKRLRAALGDSAQAPRFVETLTRRGYRFIAPIQEPADQAPETTSSAVPGPARGRLLLLAVATTFLVVAAAAFWATRHVRAERSLAAAGSIRSLAVLPLANLSGDPDQDYFVDGMTDAIRQELQAIGALQVISRTSSVHYRGNGKPLPEIARELNVDAVVDGSVLRSGNDVRINVELVRADTDKPVWRDSCKGPLRDVLGLQAQVGRAIADEIRVALTPRERARMARTAPSNPDLYRAYAKGRFFWNKRTAEDLTRAIAFFEQAIRIDPDYAAAYDGLADCWLPLGWYGYRSPADTFPNANAAVGKALSLDDSLAEAHTSLAFIKLYYDRDWAGAEREFRRGIDLNPNYSNGHHWYAEFLSLVGRHEEAISESQRARALDPLSDIVNTWVSSRYFFARQYDRAIEEGRNAVEIAPNFAPARLVLGQSYEQKGMFAEAIAELERAASLGRGNSIYAGSLAHALGAAGQGGRARKVLLELTTAAKSHFVSSYDLATATAGLGRKEETIDLLEAAVRERSPRAAFLGVDPRFDALRAEPRFPSLLRSLGLSQSRDQ